MHHCRSGRCDHRRPNFRRSCSFLAPWPLRNRLFRQRSSIAKVFGDAGCHQRSGGVHHYEMSRCAAIPASPPAPPRSRCNHRRIVRWQTAANRTAAEPALSQMSQVSLRTSCDRAGTQFGNKWSVPPEKFHPVCLLHALQTACSVPNSKSVSATTSNTSAENTPRTWDCA